MDRGRAPNGIGHLMILNIWWFDTWTGQSGIAVEARLWLN